MTWRRLTAPRGFTLIELLIALFITAIVAAAALQFYATANQVVVTQQEISDIQQINRVCLDEISTTLQMAGYMLPGQPAYAISGDTLMIFRRGTNPVDTTMYFLEEFTESEYSELMVGKPEGMHVYKLMKQINSEAADPFADYVTRVMYTPIGTRAVAVTLETQTRRPDETFDLNYGYRVFINTQRVALRNVT